MAAALGQQKPAASVLQSFPFRAALLALCVALLPLLPAQAPEGLAAAGVGQAFLAKAWELVHLLVVGIAVSYGLFSRRNDAAGDVRPEKEEAGKPADARYVSRMFRDSIAPFDDDEEDVVIPGTPVAAAGGGREDEGGGVRSWSAMHRADDPVVVVTSGRGHDTFQLPVRTLKPQPARRGEPQRRGPYQDPAARGPEETVLPSPIPWRSRSGRFDAARSASPKRLSPASSSSRETLAKATEEYYSKRVRSSPRRSSSTTPPAPPPPPPPFLVHGYHPASERRTARSFKEELQDHSVRSRRGDDRFPINRSGSFSTSAYNTSAASANSSAPAKPRSSFDSGGGGSAYSSSASVVGKSVRTFRAREPPVFQGPSQEVPEEDADDVRRDDAAQEAAVHGSEEELYGYRGYQSIPRFQYERSVSDPILGGVAVSSDETESSDDDDGGGGGAYSTRETTPEVDENEVDKKAEEFIARFREQIRRQRIESIKRSAGPRGVKHATK